MFASLDEDPKKVWIIAGPKNPKKTLCTTYTYAVRQDPKKLCVPVRSKLTLDNWHLCNWPDLIIGTNSWRPAKSLCFVWEKLSVIGTWHGNFDKLEENLTLFTFDNWHALLKSAF